MYKNLRYVHTVTLLSLSSACGFEHEWVPQREEGGREEFQDLAVGRKGVAWFSSSRNPVSVLFGPHKLYQQPPKPHPLFRISPTEGARCTQYSRVCAEDLRGRFITWGEKPREVSAQMPTDATRASTHAEKFLFLSNLKKKGAQ